MALLANENNLQGMLNGVCSCSEKWIIRIYAGEYEIAHFRKET